METDVLGWALFILTFLSWISREIWLYRERKRRAEDDASKILSEMKKLLNERISKTKDTKDKQKLTAQLNEVEVALWELHNHRLRRAFKDIGLSLEEELVADGRSLLQPQQVTRLEEVVAQVKSLPLPLSTEDLLVLGNAYYYMGQYQDAKNIYDKILNLNPDDAKTLNNRGVTYGSLERYDKALADYNRSLELRPDDPATLTNRGSTYYKLGRYDEALADYNRSLELRPDHPTIILYNLASLFSLRGKTDDALTYLEKAIDKDKKYREMAKTDEGFDNIRDDPRFKKLMESD